MRLGFLTSCTRVEATLPRRRGIWDSGLHWSASALQSLIPNELWARIQSAQVDLHTPTKEIDELCFHSGTTGELIKGVQTENFLSPASQEVAGVVVRKSRYILEKDACGYSVFGKWERAESYLR